MIKLIIFVVIIVLVISAFIINLGFFTNGFAYITDFLNSIPVLFNYIKDIINTFFNAPIINLIALTGIAFVVIKYGLSLLGDEKKWLKI